METRDLRTCVLPVNRMMQGPSAGTHGKCKFIKNEEKWRRKCLKIPI